MAVHQVASSSSRRSARLRLAAVALGVAAVASACGTSPGTEEEFAELLTREGSITQDQADCVAKAVFGKYGDDEAALDKLSFNDFDSLTSGEEAIEGFGDFYDDAVRACL